RAAARRRARAVRPALRRRDAVHAVGAPAAVRRARLARRAAARRDRHAVARCGRAAVRSRGRTRLGRLLQRRRSGGRGAGAARRRLSPPALDSLLWAGDRATWRMPDLPSLNRLPPVATLRRARNRVRSLDGRWQFRLAPSPEEAERALRRARGWTAVDVPGLWTMQGFGK